MNFKVFFLLVCTWSFVSAKSDEDHPAGVLDGIIRKVLEAMRPNLANLNVTSQDFVTGLQEFGSFKGLVKDLNIQGLEKFKVAVLETWLLNIKNLTLVQENFSVKGKYHLNGSLDFPLSRKDIHLFGDGDLSAVFTNFSFSMKVIFGIENGDRVVRELDINVGLDKMKVHLGNLMRGGELEKIFNNLFNDVGLTVFNYYKQPLLNTIKLKVKDFITDIIKQKTVDHQTLAKLYVCSVKPEKAQHFSPRFHRF